MTDKRKEVKVVVSPDKQVQAVVPNAEHLGKIKAQLDSIWEELDLDDHEFVVLSKTEM